MTPNSTLGYLLTKQLILAHTLGVKSEPGDRGPQFLAEITSAGIGLSCEAAEVLDLLNKSTRPWKRQPLDDVLADVTDEAIDNLFYLLEIFNLLGVTEADILLAYDRKYIYNMARLLGSYEKHIREDAVMLAKGILAMSEISSVPNPAYQAAIELKVAGLIGEFETPLTDDEWSLIVDPQLQVARFFGKVK